MVGSFEKARPLSERTLFVMLMSAPAFRNTLTACKCLWKAAKWSAVFPHEPWHEKALGMHPKKGEIKSIMHPKNFVGIESLVSVGVGSSERESDDSVSVGIPILCENLCTDSCSEIVFVETATKLGKGGKKKKSGAARRRRRQWQKRLRAGKGGAGASGQQQRQQQRRLGGGGKRGWVT